MRKLILALDEFQWTVDASPELPSVLQELWDRQWKKNGCVLLILCGSYIGFMEREVLGSKSPMFGRRTARILLGPLTHFQAAGFFPHWSVRNQAIAWFLCGGIPYYLEFFDPGISIDANIRATFLDRHSALFREPDFLLRKELRELPVYNGILTTLGESNARPTAIAGKTGIAEKKLGYYLKQLTELGYVTKRCPLSGRKPSRTDVLYSIDDPLLRFWLRFVSPYIGAITYQGPAMVFSSAVRPHLESYYGYCFERLCREALPYIYIKEGVTASFTVGEYWDGDSQIDVVGMRDDRWVDLGECKWGKHPGLQQALRDLRRRADAFPNDRNDSLRPRLFLRTRQKASTVPSGVTVHYLDELMAPP